MVPIFEQTPDGEHGYSFPNFEERFLSICEEHREAGRALAFAILLFDVDSPEMIKMLRDPDYWSALDRVSGSCLSVFTLLTSQPRSSHDLEFRGLAGVGPVHDPGMKLQLILRSYFGVSETVRFPSVLLFQVDRQAVSGYCFVQLRSDSVETIFNEVRALIRDVAEALAASMGQGAGESEELFTAIKRRLLKRSTVQFLKDGKKVFDNVKDIVSLAGLLT